MIYRTEGLSELRIGKKNYTALIDHMTKRNPDAAPTVAAPTVAAPPGAVTTGFSAEMENHLLKKQVEALSSSVHCVTAERDKLRAEILNAAATISELTLKRETELADEKNKFRMTVDLMKQQLHKCLVENQNLRHATDVLISDLQSK